MEILQPLSTEYLITHEDEIDWESLSRNKERSFSLAEIRIFRKKIKWHQYLLYHNMSDLQLEVASKYFDQADYDIIAVFNLASDEFIEKHKDNFDWTRVIGYSNVSAETLLKCLPKWKDINKQILIDLFQRNKFFNLKSEEFDPILLYLGLKL